MTTVVESGYRMLKWPYCKYCLCIQTLQSHFAVQREYSFSKQGQTHVDVWIYCTVTRERHYCLWLLEVKYKKIVVCREKHGVLSYIVIVFSSFVISSAVS